MVPESRKMLKLEGCSTWAGTESKARRQRESSKDLYQTDVTKDFLMSKCPRFFPLSTHRFPQCERRTAKIAQSIIWSILLCLLQPEQPPRGELPSQAIAEIIIICDKVENCTLFLWGGGISCNGKSKHVLHTQEYFVSVQCTHITSAPQPTAPEGLKPRRVTGGRLFCSR